MSTRPEVTAATELYPRVAIDAALGRVSSQGLWLLFSLDQYGWRAEFDAIRVLVGARIERLPRFGEHAALLALGQLFASVDKLWRLVYAVRANRAGRDFLSDVDGYLRSGYKVDRRLKELEQISGAEWAALLVTPGERAIRDHLAAVGATATEIDARVAFAAELPALVETNVRELQRYFEQGAARSGPLDRMPSLRDVDNRHRHGAPVVYHDCSPTDVGWIDAGDPQPDVGTGDTTGVIVTPPADDGAAFISLFAHDFRDDARAPERGVRVGRARTTSHPGPPHLARAAAAWRSARGHRRVRTVTLARQGLERHLLTPTAESQHPNCAVLHLT